MQLPNELRLALEQLLDGAREAELAKDAADISARYRADASRGSRAVSTQGQALAYAAARMPATYGAVSAALAQVEASFSSFQPQSLLDIGAGPGTAAWAACLRYPSIGGAVLLEPEAAMRAAGQAIIEASEAPPDALRHAHWIADDIRTANFPNADLVIASYSINELPQDTRVRAAERLFAAAGQLLLIIEPGTPAGTQELLSIREALLSFGAHIAAPCPHDDACPLAEDDWCHFSVRIERGRLHKRLKGGDAPYEDEKYSYLAFAKEQSAMPRIPRILRHPLVRPGNVTLSLCAAEGLFNITVPRGEKAAFKAARKAKAGEHWPHNRA